MGLIKILMHSKGKKGMVSAIEEAEADKC